MSGYVCIAMLEDPPYNMIVSATVDHPEVWVGRCPLPAHLLFYRQSNDAGGLVKEIIKSLKGASISAKCDTPFPCKPFIVLNSLIDVLSEKIEKQGVAANDGLHTTSIECVSCGTLIELEWLGQSSFSVVECRSCKTKIYGYRCTARSQRSTLIRDHYRCVRNLMIRTFDLDKSERLITLHESSMNPEIKSKDSLLMIASEDVLLVYNKTIGAQYKIYDTKRKGMYNDDGSICISSVDHEKAKINKYLALLGFVELAV
jgi:hypothetical protein